MAVNPVFFAAEIEVEGSAAKDLYPTTCRKVNATKINS